MKRTLPALLALALAAGTTPAHAADPTAEGILWNACPVEYEGMLGGLGKRLQCGVMLAPRDWRADDTARDTPVGLVRIVAGARSKRQGAIFMNFGGPGIHPASVLMDLGKAWQAIPATDPDQGSKRRIMQQFDLVAVVPRGLDASSDVQCAPLEEDAANAYFLGERSDAHWQALVDGARQHAETCSARIAPTPVDSEQHVRDMELARRLLGEDTLNFYGASYGGWVGALYGSLFPERVGRMVLDSTVDASGSIERFHLLRPRWREHDLARITTTRAAAQPAFWGLGSDSKAIRVRLQAMPMVLRALWLGQIVNPEDVVAALQVADLYAAEPAARRTRSVLADRIRGHHFHDRIDQTVTRQAEKLVALLPEQATDTPIRYGWPAVTLATYCGDGTWRSTANGVRAALGDNTPFASFDEGDSSLLMLICSQWPNAHAATPDMTALGRVPGLLMIHSDLDRFTPLRGAESMASSLPNAHLLVVDDLATHGVMNGPATCAVRAAGDFLLTGTLPGTTRSMCKDGAVVPRTPSDAPRDEL